MSTYSVRQTKTPTSLKNDEDHYIAWNEALRRTREQRHILPGGKEAAMTRYVLLVMSLLFAFCAPSVLAQSATAQRFENATAGISLMRPAGWQTASLQTVQENRERVQLSDAELQAAMQKAATAPLFVFLKHAEPNPHLNPSIQITLRPLGTLAGQAPTEILKLAVSTLQKALPDFMFVTEITNAQVSGLAAAHMRAKYTVMNRDGASFKVLTRMWLVPRGSYMFMIGMSGPQEGPDVSEAEFSAALASISIQK